MTSPENSTNAPLGPNPYSLAEQLDSTELVMPVSTDNVLTADTAWFLVEQFLNDNSSEHRDERIEQARLETMRAAQESVGVKRRIRAQMLLANFPLLALRGYRQKIEADDITQSYYMMAGVVADNARQYKRSKAVSEAITFALIARQRDTMNIPFVGSPRERKSLWPGGSHGIYTVDDNVTLKTAVRVFGYKEDSIRQSPFVYPHSLGNFLIKNGGDLEALEKMGAVSPHGLLGEATAQLIAGEPTDGYPLGSSEDVILTTLSDRLITQLNGHRLKVLGLPSRSKASVPKTPPRALPKFPPPRPRPAIPGERQPAPKVEPDPENLTVVSEPIARPHDVFFMKNNLYKFINPYLPAESIPPEVLEQQRIADDDQLVSSLWKTIELGVVLRDSKQVLRASDEAQNIAHDSGQPALDRVNAAMLSASSGLLALRAAGELATENDILKSFQAMARVLGNVRSYNYGQLDNQWYVGKVAELVNYCLVAYGADLQYIPYLGSTREERTRLPAANHDMYTMLNRAGASKVSAQIKSKFSIDISKWFGTPENVHRSFLFPIFTEEVLHAHALESGPRRSGKVSFVAQLIVRAAHNGLISTEKITLQGFSKAIVQLFADHRDFLLTEEKYHQMPYTNLSPEEYKNSL